ncbi:hypothetical protein IC582_019094 [Cucumis melo]
MAVERGKDFSLRFSVERSSSRKAVDSGETNRDRFTCEQKCCVWGISWLT